MLRVGVSVAVKIDALKTAERKVVGRNVMIKKQ